MARSPKTLDLNAAWELRRPERQLLLWVSLSMALGFLMVYGGGRSVERPFGALDLVPIGIYWSCLVIIHATLVAARFKGDQVLLVALAFLSGLGLLAQYRMGVYEGGSLTSYLLYPIGVLVLLSTALGGRNGRYNRLAAGLWVWAVLSVLLLIVVLATGQRFRGAVYAAGFITPTEFLKVSVVLFTASYIDRYGDELRRWRHLVIPPVMALAPLFGFWVLLSGLLLIQRDLGMLVILMVPLLVMLVLGTGRIAYLVYGGVIAGGVAHILLGYFMHGERRLQAWSDPFVDPTGNSWQILQGLSGMFSGGLWGEGFGQGRPDYIPIAQSDFIYAVIGEELGFVGSILVVAFFIVLIDRGFRVASRTRSPFGMLVCVGLTSVLAVQIFLNIGGVTKLIPLTGITLPFISQGGSSLLTGFVALGLILAVSDGEPAPKRRRKKRSKRR